MPPRSPKSLRNDDYSDLELLQVMSDVADERGLVHAGDVADRLRIRTNGKRTPAGTVSTRLSWMARYGYVRRIDPLELGLRRADGPRWVLTRDGEELLRGRVTSALRRELDRAGIGGAVLVQREIAATAFMRASSPAFSAALRRQFMHTYANRRR